MIKVVKYIIGLGLLASATAAAASDLPPELLDDVMATCRPDQHRVCRDVIPGEGRVARCLLDHEPELAPPCLSKLKLAYAMEVCMPDYQRFCNGIAPGGGQIVECLADRMEALAPECRRIVTANAPYAAPYGERYGYNRPPAQPYGYNRPPAQPYAYSERQYSEHAYSEHAYGDRPYGDDRYAGEADRDAPDYDRYANRGYDRYRGPQPYDDQRYPDNGPEEEREPIK
jgi:hypothetical protein